MLKRIELHWQILIALIISILLGIFFPGVADHISWLGEIFMRALKMIVIPLVVSSLITGITNIGKGKQVGRIGLKTIIYYLTTSLIAILIGLILVNWIKPGVGAESLLTSEMKGFTTNQTKPISETLLEIIPKNIFESLTKGDMLPIIFFSLLFGWFINTLEESKNKILKNIFQSVFDVMMKITLLILKFAPLGVIGIVTKVVAEQSDLWELVMRLKDFMFVVVSGLSIHFFLILPLILFLGIMTFFV